MASFYHTIANADDLVKCPYDPVHMIRMKKLPYHLMKCRKNYPNKSMVTCPFNAGHVVPEAEIRFHTASCPDKHSVELVKKGKGADSWIKGNTDVPTYFPDVPTFESTEDWDAEAAVPRIGVQARDVAGIGYHKNLAGLQRHQKRQFYENLRKGDEEANVKMMESLNVADEAGGDSSSQPEPAASFAQPTLGRGRGLRTAAVSSKEVKTPGASSVPEDVNIDDLKRLAKKTRKKLRQIDHLLQRQAGGEMLNEEEKIKVASKATFELQFKTLVAKIQAAEPNIEVAAS